MVTRNLDLKSMNKILRKAITAIEESKTEIFDIAERARRECEVLKNELEGLKDEINQLIQQVENLEILERDSRKHLISVSKNFQNYKEDDIRQAYEKANELQIKLILKRQEEKELIKRRTELEMRYKNSYEVLMKAENLISKIGIALEFLGGNLQDLTNTLEDIQQRHIMGRKIISAQEEERRRVARDIHDGPAQSLANVVIKAEVCEKLIDIDLKKTKQELQELKSILRDSIKDIRKIIYNLRPMSLDDFGFIPTIQRFIDSFQNETQIQVDFIILSQLPVEDTIKNLSIYRIIQEALNNVRKHAKATNVKIKVEITKKMISLSIIDNGIGFDMEHFRKEEKQDTGFGLLNMRERVELLNGEFEIKSELNKGTKIFVNIPNEE